MKEVNVTIDIFIIFLFITKTIALQTMANSGHLCAFIVATFVSSTFSLNWSQSKSNPVAYHFDRHYQLSPIHFTDGLDQEKFDEGSKVDVFEGSPLRHLGSTQDLWIGTEQSELRPQSLGRHININVLSNINLAEIIRAYRGDPPITSRQQPQQSMRRATRNVSPVRNNRVIVF